MPPILQGARHFVSGSSITIGQGLIPSTISNVTVVGIGRRTSDANSGTIINFGYAGDNGNFYIEQTGSWLSLYNGGTLRNSTVALLAADGWCFFAISHASGAVVRGHKYVYGTGVWSHGSSASTVPDSAPSGNARIGNNVTGTGADFRGDMAALGVFNRVLTDGEYVPLAFSLDAWLTQGLVARLRLDRFPVIDDVGASRQNAVSGTSWAQGQMPAVPETLFPLGSKL